jgi:DNA replication initiation complex subunit (GINS family)
MYDELYAAWRLEIDNNELACLSSDFYMRLADYLRRIKEENLMLDTAKRIKTNLIAIELANASRMAQELVSIRYRKLVKLVVAGQKMPYACLASEERALYSGVGSSGGAFRKFKEDLMGGQLTKSDVDTPAASTQEIPGGNSRVTIRFLKPVPSIIGVDMKSYGPFLVEDVASVPLDNARILIKQGLAKAIELQ